MSTNNLHKQKIECYIVVFKTVSKLASNEKIYFRKRNIYIQNNTLKTSIDRTINIVMDFYMCHILESRPMDKS